MVKFWWGIKFFIFLFFIFLCVCVCDGGALVLRIFFFFLGMEIFWLYVLVYEIDELNFYVAEPQGVSKC